MNAAKRCFCTTFGRERVNDGPVTKTNRARKDDMFFKTRFHTDAFVQHHKLMHSKHWSTYKYLTDEQKAKYFIIPTSYAETIPSFFEGADKTVIDISCSIIDGVMKPFFISDTSDIGFRNTLLELLNRVDTSLYTLTISNTCKFDLVTRFVAEAQSFRHTSGSARAPKEVSSNPNFRDVVEKVVRQFVQATTATNLKHIRRLILDKRYCDYSIAFAAETNREDSYLDVIVRIAVSNSVQNFHVLSIPMVPHWIVHV